VALLQLPGAALAAPLQWQLESATDQPSPVGGKQAAANPRKTGPLVWEPDSPEPSAKDLALLKAANQPKPQDPGTKTPGPGSAAAGPAPQKKPKYDPKEFYRSGEPRYGVPVEQPYSSPYLGGALPGAYLAGWGSFYIGGSAATPGKLRDGQIDGSINAGIGLGDFYKTVAISINWGVGSTKNIGANGAFSTSVGRLLIDKPRLQVAAAGGIFNLYSYGSEGKDPLSGYGVVTVATPLRPNSYDFQQVLQMSLGYGGGRQFAYVNPDTFDYASASLFGSIGVELTKNFGISAGVSGRGTNINLSYTPFRGLPISVNLLAADAFDQSPWGTVGVLSVTWGDDFRTALF